MALIYIRKATESDENKIVEIINEAKKLLKADHSSQWQDGHPNRATIQADIKQGNSWVLIFNNEIAGTAALVPSPDQAYQIIEEGKWNNETDPYLTIHRIAIASKYQGQHLSQYFFSNLISIGMAKQYKNFRLDTYHLNLRLQHLASSNNFTKRGIIHVQDQIDSRRIAYELNI